MCCNIYEGEGIQILTCLCNLRNVVSPLGHITNRHHAPAFFLDVFYVGIDFRVLKF